MVDEGLVFVKNGLIAMNLLGIGLLKTVILTT